MRLPALVLLLLVAPLSGCKASLSADLNASARANGDSDPTPPPSSDSLGQRTKTAFIGVTQALSLTDEASATAACQCLAAAVGSPRDGAFQWRGPAPLVGEDAIVLAIGNSERTPCHRVTGEWRPSIRGVETEGNDIIVTLEEPRPGVPAARGAVMQRPTFDGGYVVFRANRRLPYGHPLPASQSAVCRLPLGGTSTAARKGDPAPATVSPRRAIATPINTF